MIRTTKLLGAAALALLLGTGCDNEELMTPAIPGAIPAVDPMYTRYVSLGNSITAGFQSGGINDATQAQSYAVLLARAMQSPFYVPWMAFPGCPALYTNVFTQARVSTIPCALRRADALPPPYISNVAVPGAEVIDGYANLDTASNPNALTTFFLGGYTQMQMVERARPTFVSVWIGNNDVLGAATNAANAGDSTRITPVSAFQTRYGALVDSVAAVNPQGAVLVGVANVTAIPYFSKGDVYFFIKAGTTQFPTNFQVAANCAPDTLGGQGTTTLVPFPYGAGLIGAAVANPLNTYTLDCNVAQVVVPAERAKLIATVTAYNSFIQQQASNHTWGYLDPNPVLDSLKLIPTQVAPFPTIGAACTANPFGLAFSCDAVHPSAATHRLIAIYLRAAINTAYPNANPIPAIP